MTDEPDDLQNNQHGQPLGLQTNQTTAHAWHECRQECPRNRSATFNIPAWPLPIFKLAQNHSPLQLHDKQSAPNCVIQPRNLLHPPGCKTKPFGGTNSVGPGRLTFFAFFVPPYCPSPIISVSGSQEAGWWDRRGVGASFCAVFVLLFLCKYD